MLESGRCGAGKSERVYKALRSELAAVLEELKRIEAGGNIGEELFDNIELIAEILYGFKENEE